MDLRALEPNEARAIVDLRREALSTSPLAFSASEADDLATGVEAVRAMLARPSDSAILGALEEGRLVGVVGIYRPQKLKSRHRAMIWGMYVRPHSRSRGVGGALLRAAVEHARSWPGVVQVQLSVSGAAVPARRLYERAGFREWGVEPRALCWDGDVVDEHHLVLALDEE